MVSTRRSTRKPLILQGTRPQLPISVPLLTCTAANRYGGTEGTVRGEAMTIVTE